MFKRFFKTILKLIYRQGIYKTLIVNKDSREHYKRVEPYCVIKINTTEGEFCFSFKKDRRLSHQKQIPGIHTYIVELLTPPELVPVDSSIIDKIVIVIRLTFFKIDEELLAEILTEIYIDKMLTHIKENRKSKL